MNRFQAHAGTSPVCDQLHRENPGFRRGRKTQNGNQDYGVKTCKTNGQGMPARNCAGGDEEGGRAADRHRRRCSGPPDGKSGRFTSFIRIGPRFCGRQEWKCNKFGEYINGDELFEDWGRVARKVKCIPCSRLYGIHGKYAPTTLGKRHGGWDGVCPAFAEFAAGKPEWADVMELIESRKEGPGVPPVQDHAWPKTRDRRLCTRSDAEMALKPKPQTEWRSARQRRDVMSFGPSLALPAMRNAPVNEAGVVYLFGTLAERLGFSVEAVRLGVSRLFCEATRGHRRVAKCEDRIRI